MVGSIPGAVISSPAPGKRVCAFCAAHGPLTLEHVLPHWLVEALGPFKTGGQHTVFHAPPGESRKVVRRWLGLPFTAKARQVCTQCNTGWMSRLEIAASPTLAPLMRRALTVTLDPKTRELLAFWAVKTCMALQLIDPLLKRHMTIPRAHYRETFANQRPPLQSEVWFGYVTGSQTFSAYLRQPVRFEERNDQSPVRAQYDAYYLTLLVGHLAFCVYGYDAPGHTPFGFRGDVAQYLSRIWPVGVGIVASPPMTLRESTLWDLAESLNRFPTSQ